MNATSTNGPGRGVTAAFDERKAAAAAEEVEASRYDMPGGWVRWLVGAIAVAFSCFQLYTAAFGTFEQMIQRSVHLAFAAALIALTFRFFRPVGARKGRVSLVDWAFFAAALFSTLWVVWDYDRIINRIFDVDPLTPLDWVAGSLLILVVLEFSRRTVSAALSVLMAGDGIQPVFDKALKAAADRSRELAS